MSNQPEPTTVIRRFATAAGFVGGSIGIFFVIHSWFWIRSSDSLMGSGEWVAGTTGRIAAAIAGTGGGIVLVLAFLTFCVGTFLSQKV